MSKRRINIAEFGFTEEQWAALPEDRRVHFRAKASYQRHKAERQARQREYARRKKAEREKGH